VRVDTSRLELLLPLYAGLFAMSAAVLTALGLAIDTPEFIIRAELLVFAGLAASLLGAVTGRNPAVLGAIVAGAVFPLLVLSNTGAPVTELFFPQETLGDHSLLLPTLAVWSIIAISFAQVNRANSIFIFVCGLVVFGLTGTVNLNESLLLSFFVFLLGTYFVWAYNGALNLYEQAQAVGQEVSVAPLRWAYTQVGTAAALLGVVFAAAVLTGWPMYRTTRNFFLTPFSPQFRPRATLTIAQNYAGFREEFSLLGGTLSLSESPAMTVHADAPALWRGLAYDYYNGRGWERLARGEEFLLPDRPAGSFRREVPRTNRFIPHAARMQHVRQTIRLQADMAGVLPAAAMPVAVQGTTHAFRPKIDLYGCLHGRPPLAFDPEYEVESVVPLVQRGELEAAPYDPDLLPAYVRESYLQVPADTRARLQGLADRLTEGCRTPHEKANAILAYLYEKCRYTLEVPPLPPRQDAAAYFLLKTHRGACDLYASSFTILMRLADVPARVVTGYDTGEWDSALQGYEVTGADAHAWAEVYYQGIGWIEYNPPVQKEPERFQWLRRLMEPGLVGPTLISVGKSVLLTVLTLVVLNALVLAVSGASPLQMGAQWVRRRRQSPDPRQRVALAYLDVCEALGRRGVPREVWQTPTDFLHEVAVAETLPDDLRGAGMRALTEAFLRLRYGMPGPSLTDAGAFARSAQDLARRFRRARRTPARPAPADGGEPPSAG
jgi:hypothetical protein